MEIVTKFDIGQKVWVIDDNKAKELNIGGIDVYVLGIYPSIIYVFLPEYDGEDNPIRFNEHLVFATKQDLINSL